MPPRVLPQWEFGLPLRDYGEVGAALRDTACTFPYDDERPLGWMNGRASVGVPRLPLHLILFYSCHARTLSFFPAILSCPPLSPPP
jgi:hypothetical protein